MTKASILILVSMFTGIGQLFAADSAAPNPSPMPAMPMTMPMNGTATPKTTTPAATDSTATLGMPMSGNTGVKGGDVLAAYVKISVALAADNLADAKTSATALADLADKANRKDIATQASALGKAADIAAARNSFKTLSATVEALATGEKAYVVMYCPMQKADWVQATGKTQNPYYGKAMIDCGSPKVTK